MTLRVPNLPFVSRSQIDKALIALDRAVGPSKLLLDAEARAPYARDDSPAQGRLPDVVVLAESREDVLAVLRIAEAHDVPVTPRAAGTGRTGGAVPVAGGIVLSMNALDRVVDLDRREMVVVVQPGLKTGALHALAEAEGLFYPPDPSSAADCTLGGNAAENAGGPRAFKYGVTRDYVLGTETALIGGRALRTGRRTVKGVTGYDVTALLVGSEGTLGVFTELTLRLVPEPRTVATVLVLFTDVHGAAAAVSRIVCGGLVPRCLELLDALTLDAVRKDGVSIDPRAGAMLLLEVDGEDAHGQAERLGELVVSCAGVLDVLTAQDAAQRARLWEARKKLSYATRKLAKHKLSEDVVVPRTKIPDLLARVDAIGAQHRVRHLAYGHAGDGNLHVNFLWDDDDEAPRVDAAIGALMRATIELGGTLSGEHGIGLAKAPYLHLEQSEELIEVQRGLKRVFDPRGLLNPGKIFPQTGHRGC